VQTATDDELLSGGELRRHLGVGRETVLRYVRRGVLTPVVVQEKPRRVKFRLSEVQARQEEVERGR
jgi:predicted site-specific integrase-resolvase